MSPKKVDEHADLIRRAERGRRVAEIRGSLGLTGEAFAAALNKLAAAYGYPTHFDESKISKMERGFARGVTVEEGALLVSIDPEERGITWLAFGGPPVKAMRRKDGSG